SSGVGSKLGERSNGSTTPTDSPARLSHRKGAMIRITGVRPLTGYEVELTFTDGTAKVVDLGPRLRGPIFEPLKADLALFREVRVDPELGTIVWPNGADLDPDVIYAGWTPAWARNSE